MKNDIRKELRKYSKEAIIRAVCNMTIFRRDIERLASEAKHQEVQILLKKTNEVNKEIHKIIPFSIIKAKKLQELYIKRDILDNKVNKLLGI